MKTISLKNSEPERLDKILTDILGVSRSKIQKAIKNGKITVDGKVVPAKFLVSTEHTIEYDPEVFKKSTTKYKPPTLEIIYEDDDVLVVNKPAGLLVHETDTSHEPTLVDGLKALNDIEHVGDDPSRAGLVHRLDKYASGALITAKTQTAFNHLKEQFKKRHVKKTYTVLVHEPMEKEMGTITLPISRAKSTGRMASKPESQGGKEAITHYEVITSYPHHALLKVQIETGRTHQIRSHMFAINHSVVGDTLYRQRSRTTLNIGRIFLHASELTITLPNGEEKTFKAPLPKKLKEVLEEIPKI